MKNKTKEYIKCICFVLTGIISNQIHAINLLEIALKAFLLTGTAAADVDVSDREYPYNNWHNITFPFRSTDKLRGYRVGRCPEDAEFRFRAQVACVPPDKYHCLNSMNSDEVFVETCRSFEWVHTGNKAVFNSPGMNIAYQKCTPPYITPKTYQSNEKEGCVRTEKSCVSEGQISRTDQAPYNSSRARQLCACDEDNGYQAVSPKFVSEQFIKDGGKDYSCFFNASIERSKISLTKDEIIGSGLIDIDGYIDHYNDVRTLINDFTKESILPPIILIAGGVPFLIIIPLCLLRYSVASDDTADETNETDAQRISGAFLDEDGNMVTVQCNIQIDSNTGGRGRLAVDGAIVGDNNKGGSSLLQSLLSGFTRSGRAGVEKFSAVSRRVLAIGRPSVEDDLCECGAIPKVYSRNTKIQETVGRW
ncbi:MAG: hypothetical protein QS721_15225 [Candidatus Endonucleobacter sp. (ex Gigantidas childressi)]|nr:hypothetical protein [Candidatus Endonucleobacter sp. (ex Gigantidas childressi)]